MKYSNTIPCILLSVIISGCALFGSDTKSSKVKVPSVALVNPPGGTDKNWRYLGTSDDGQLIVEINDNSIVSTTPQVYNYQDRKTIVNPNKFTSYLSGQPHYKYLISNWQLNCNDKKYIILNTSLYNESAIQISSNDYASDNSVKWINIGSGSLAELQYNYICLNKNRDLGY